MFAVQPPQMFMLRGVKLSEYELAELRKPNGIILTIPLGEDEAQPIYQAPEDGDCA
jgi:hypothetical protein